MVKSITINTNTGKTEDTIIKLNPVLTNYLVITFEEEAQKLILFLLLGRKN